MTRFGAGRAIWVALALAMALSFGGNARADEAAWDSSSNAEACSVVYEVKPDRAPAWAHMVGILWRADGTFGFFLLGRNLDELTSIPLQVASASGAVFKGTAVISKSEGKGPHAYTMWVSGRKDLEKALVGDLTFTFRDQAGKMVSITAPFGIAVPRIDACMSNAVALASAAPAAGDKGSAAGDDQSSDDAAAEAAAIAAAKPGEIIATGTGVAIDMAGHVVTVAHVVSGCGFVDSPTLGRAEVVAVDSASDLALLRFSLHTSGAITVRTGSLRLGETVVAAGFPLQTVLQNGLNVTVGNLSALSGMQGDRRQIQFSAPTTFGNSGGPLIDSSGRLIGLVDAGMQARLGQNINFAVAGPTIQSFLDENGVAYRLGKDAPVTPAEIAAQARRHTVLLLCHK